MRLFWFVVVVLGHVAVVTFFLWFSPVENTSQLVFAGDKSSRTHDRNVVIDLLPLRPRGLVSQYMVAEPNTNVVAVDHVKEHVDQHSDIDSFKEKAISPLGRYLLATELDKKPSLKESTIPEFYISEEQGVPDKIVLTLLINAEGKVEGILVKESLPVLLYQKINEAFADVRFLPGEQAGKPVPSQMDIELVPEKDLLEVQ